MEKSKGKVKSFNSLKGYGFIETDKGDLFFHISELKGQDVFQGDEVEYEIGKSEKGDKAVRVKIMQKEE